MGSLLWLTQFLCFLFFHFHLQACFNCSLPLSSNLNSSKHRCPTHQSLALLQFKKSFSIDGDASDSSHKYPKTESWKEGTDCCSWNGITCDLKSGHVIGLDLASSMLHGTLHPNSTLFSLLHLRKLDLSDNYFNSSSISSQFGQFFYLTHLNLSYSFFPAFSSQVPPEISHLSKLVSLDLSLNDDLALEPISFNKLAQNLTRLKDLNLGELDMSLVAPNSLMDLSSSLSSLQLWGCGLQGKFPDNIFGRSNLQSMDLSGNEDLTVSFPPFNVSSVLSSLDVSQTRILIHLDHGFTSNIKSLKKLYIRDCNLVGSKLALLANLTQLIELDISNNQLGGHIPFSLGKLERLNSLNLGSNNFGGPIPDDFVNLTRLTELDLSNNRFEGHLPSSLANLKQLNHLFLSSNNLTGQILNEFANLTHLTELDLSYNNFRDHTPSPLGSLNQLTRLSLSRNTFSCQIPNEFGNLTQLIMLDLSSNNFYAQIPSSLENLTQLTYLDLSNNKFGGQILSSFENLTQLTYLKLSNNKFSGQIPSSLENLPQLTVLDLSNNKFSGQIPSSLGNFTQLTDLDLSNNTFDGQIPSSLGNLAQLIYLYLSNNKFDGQIPSSLGNITQLSDLNLSNNRFGGKISSSFGNLQQLNALDLSSNNFISEIPNGLANLTLLSYLDLSNNRLRGQMPSLLNDPFVINLSHNKLHGPIPHSFFKLEHLRVLILSSNDKLTGKISSVICNLKSLQILDLSNNDFSGFIPQCLGNFSNWLSVLHLGANNLHGTMPSTFSKGSNLRYLNFNGNQLKGVIPPSVINCTNLEFLDLGNNMIDDTFPSFLEMLSELKILVLRSNKIHGSLKGSTVNDSFSKLRIFDLSNNSLSGPLPTEYFNNFNAMVTVDQNMEYMKAKNVSYATFFDYSVTLTWKGLQIEFVKIQTALTTLDLSGNRFTGKMPESLGKLESLKELNLSHNRLTGYIHPSLANLTNLESLDLSSNLFAGRIPQQLADLTSLEVLNLSFNRLEGPIPLGKQFNTFGRGSYEGNLALCGFPLQECNNGEGQQVPPPSNFQKEDDSMFGEGFGWKAVAMGYGCSFVFGVFIGYIVFRIRKPAWFVRMAEGGRHQNAKRFRRRNAPRNGERRN